MINLKAPLPQAKGLTYTPEMTAIMNHEPVSDLVVEAGAGSGKTTLLVEYAKKWKLRALYISFNKAIALEAGRRFPDLVDPMTAHSYAFKAMKVGRHASRLKAKIRRQDLRDNNIDLNNPFMSEDKMIKAVLAGIANFTNDAGDMLTATHCGLGYVPKPTQDRVMPIIAKAVLQFVNYEESGLPFTHDCYLKQLEMHGQMGKEYDYIMVDEAQDLNPILLSLITRSNRPLIIVGDRKQSIYAFRGSIDAMAEIDAPRLPLSQSWRFGAPVDKLANHILSYTSEPPEWKLRGRPEHETKITEYNGRAPAHSLILSRTNGRLFEGLVNITVPFHVIGGFETIANQLLSALALSKGERGKIYDPLIQGYQNWGQLKSDAENDDDPEIRRIVKIIEEYGSEIVTILARLEKLSCQHQGQAHITMSTAHKAKGLEANSVVVLDDFATPSELYARRSEKKISEVEYDQEFHLLYVTMTRAIDNLMLSTPLYNAFEDIIEDGTE